MLYNINNIVRAYFSVSYTYSDGLSIYLLIILCTSPIKMRRRLRCCTIYLYRSRINRSGLLLERIIISLRSISFQNHFFQPFTVPWTRISNCDKTLEGNGRSNKVPMAQKKGVYLPKQWKHILYLITFYSLNLQTLCFNIITLSVRP